MKEGFLQKMERKLSKYALKNITIYLIACYAFGYIIELVNADFLNYLTLEPAAILHGQVWRLFTWLIIPPSSSNLFLVLIVLYFYYSIGRSLEMVWGTYKLNLYLFGGMLFTIVGAFLCYFIYTYAFGVPISTMGYMFSTYYVNMSIFLAYAATFPEMEVYLFFILPIKVRVLGIIYAVLMLFDVVSCWSNYGMLVGLLNAFVVCSSLLNFLVFFFTTRGRFATPAQMKIKREFKKATSGGQYSRGTNARGGQMHADSNGAPKMVITKHKCAVCGRTEKSHPELEFRFCSKCNGNYEYCSDHLFTHEHIK